MEMLSDTYVEPDEPFRQPYMAIKFNSLLHPNDTLRANDNKRKRNHNKLKKNKKEKETIKLLYCVLMTPHG